jgi:HAD superfamily hydrolase (TIGR01458 family)
MASALRALLVDIDGTILFKGEPVEGAARALEALRATGLKLRFLTNTDSRDAGELVKELHQAGLHATRSEVVTAIDAACAYIAKRGPGRCFCLMPKRLAHRFYTLYPEEGEVRYVVVGDPRETTSYTALNAAFRYAMAGAEIVAAQHGRYFISRDGYQLDTGAVVALLEYATGKEATVVGKPAPAFFHAAIADLGVSAGETMVVGDDVTTDVAGARTAGMRSVLVRTGKYASQEARAHPYEPDHVIDSVAALPALLSE